MKLSRTELILEGRRVAGELMADGLKPTLRQLYYRLVAAALIANSQREYKRLGAALTVARKNGSFPLDWIEDRTREPKPTTLYISTDPDAAADHAADELARAPGRLLWASRWYGQPVIPSVWVEKEALASVFERACDGLGVGLFVCRGYPSLTALHDWLTAFEHTTAGKVVIQYYGDHDPDGLQIPESAFETLRELAWARGSRLFSEVRVSLDRVALTLDQVDEVNAPPFHAKVTSSRYAGYVEATGTEDAWELDALPPKYLDRLIRDTANALFSAVIAERNQVRVRAARDELRELIESGEVAGRALALMGSDR